MPCGQMNSSILTFLFAVTASSLCMRSPTTNIYVDEFWKLVVRIHDTPDKCPRL